MRRPTPPARGLSRSSARPARRPLRRPRRAAWREVRDHRPDRPAPADHRRAQGPRRGQGRAEAARDGDERRRALDEGVARLTRLEARMRRESGDDGAARTRPFAGFEWMLAGPLSARAPRAGLRFGDRRLFVPRHHARRRDADRRHVGHERLSQRAHDKIVGINGHIFIAADRFAADRLTPRSPSGSRGSGRAPRGADGRGSGVRVVALQRHRRAGARRARRRHGESPAVAGNVRQGTLDNFDEAAASRSAAARRESGRAGRRQDHAHLAARRADAVRRRAAHEGLSGRRRSSRSACRNSTRTFVFMPLQEAQAFFNLDGEASVIEVFLDNPDRMDECRAQSSRRASGRWS